VGSALVWVVGRQTPARFYSGLALAGVAMGIVAGRVGAAACDRLDTGVTGLVGPRADRGATMPAV